MTRRISTPSVELTEKQRNQMVLMRSLDEPKATWTPNPIPVPKLSVAEARRNYRRAELELTHRRATCSPYSGEYQQAVATLKAALRALNQALNRARADGLPTF